MSDAVDDREAIKAAAAAFRVRNNTDGFQMPPSGSGSAIGSMRNEPFSFTGSAIEYFKIWIVNLLLTIITIGFYSPWAKVRRLKYFYGNTWVDNHNFDYVADPVSILKGRVIVLAVLGLYNLLVYISPIFLLLIIAYMIALPWVLRQSLAFNARMTIYRNVRFGFRNSLWGAAKAFVLLPLATIALLSIGLFMAFAQTLSELPDYNIEAFDNVPWFTGVVVILFAIWLIPVTSRSSSNYVGSGTYFGSSKFTTDAPLKALVINLLIVILFMAGVYGVLLGTLFLFDGFDAGEAAQGIISIVAIAAYLSLFAVGLLYAVGVRNIAFNATELEGGHRLISNVSRPRYVWIMFSNTVVVVLTLGLMRPWAAVRTWRYLAASTAVAVNGSMDNVVGQAQTQGSVTTAEFLDFEGIDFGL
jgi:uncharacterized membrane protein YjgN (DUF898 family)